MFNKIVQGKYVQSYLFNWYISKFEMILASCLLRKMLGKDEKEREGDRAKGHNVKVEWNLMTVKN